ncbi:MAG: prepilin-type N-terminal cleavage/methylation domain-containing protein [Verrucomicrobiales bacterium]|nr:prepilin-type N-terminal cleavage/methylation domain-containing protein [Verrucomicrobiales bacterium]
MQPRQPAFSATGLPIRRNRDGFTLVELMVVFAIIGLLVGLLLPALARSKGRAHEVHCRKNQRDLFLAWSMYADENEGRLPAVKGGSFAGADRWVSGWLDFTSSPDNTNALYLTDERFSQVGPYVSDAPAVYRCPSDRTTVNLADGAHPRVRSVSMNCWLNYTGTEPIGEDEYRVFRNINSIFSPSPSELWVLIDERPDSINDGMFITNLKNRGNLAKLVDFPAGWHNRGAGITYADGHSEIKRWEDERTTPELKPTQLLRLDVLSPGNRDVAWLQKHSSSRRSIPAEGLQ